MASIRMSMLKWIFTVEFTIVQDFILKYYNVLDSMDIYGRILTTVCHFISKYGHYADIVKGHT